MGILTFYLKPSVKIAKGLNQRLGSKPCWCYSSPFATKIELSTKFDLSTKKKKQKEKSSNSNIYIRNIQKTNLKVGVPSLALV